MAKHGFAQIVLLVLSQRCDWRARALFARPWAGLPNLAESRRKIIVGAQAASDTTRTANQAFLPPDEQITCRAGVIGDQNLSINPIRRLAAGKLEIKGAR
jgi:hypothetical protein